MHKQITHCLLCTAELHEQYGWTQFFTAQIPPAICNHCEGKFTPIMEQREAGALSLYEYNEAMKDYIHRYKFMQDVVLAKVFARQLREVLKHESAIIVPVPMHPENLKKRTFAPIDEMLIQAQIPFEHYLEKMTTSIQVGKNRTERLQSELIFQLLEQKETSKNQFVIVDDIYTTGTTIRHATKVLMDAGATQVKAITLVHG